MWRNALTVVLCCVAISLSTRALDVITTAAGNGTSPSFGNIPPADDGVATAVPVPSPKYLSISKTGLILISEAGRVRRYDPATGQIISIAGLGDVDDNQAIGTGIINLRLNSPYAGYIGNGTIGILTNSGINTQDLYICDDAALTVTDSYDEFTFSDDDDKLVAFNPFTSVPVEDYVQGEIFLGGSYRILSHFSQRISGNSVSISSDSIYAGTTPGFGGDGGPALLAKINDARYLYCALNGDLYFYDFLNFRVRSIDRATQTIRTVLGNGVNGFIQANVLASNTAINRPNAIAADTFGNTYYATIRTVYKVDPTGLVTVVVNEADTIGFSGDGGDARTAALRQISCMACDSAGNLYIADWQDNRVRKVTFGPRITSALSANAVQGQAFTYTISATGSKTITYATSPAVPGLTLNGNVLSGTPTTPGDYEITLTATNSAAADSKILKLKVLSVNAPAPPLITSALNATGTVGSAFTYTLTVTGAIPITLSATGLPSGLSFDGATVSGTPATAGVFSITLSATNVSATDTQTLTLRIDPQPTTGGPGTPGGGGNGPGINLPGADGSNSVIDTDGDGFSDEMETQLGSDPKNPNSTPMNNKPAGPQSPFDVTKVAIKLSFVSDGKDNLSISGKLPISEGFVVGGQKVITDVGGVIREFQLNDKGQGGPINDASFKVAIRAKKGVVLAQEAKFSIRIGKLTVGSTYDDEGFPTRTITGTVVKPVPVAILFNGISYRSAENLEYNSRNGKTATIK